MIDYINIGHHTRAITDKLMPLNQLALSTLVGCPPIEDGAFNLRPKVQIILLTQGKTTLVDDVDFEWLSQFNWHAKAPNNDWCSWYAIRDIYNHPDGSKQKKVRMHRVILDAPIGLSVDHINGDGLDNRRLNLRICTHCQNTWNQHRTRGSSTYKGVCWSKDMQKWIVSIGLNGRQLHLGYYKSERIAASKYDEAALKYFGEFAFTNKMKFPRDFQ